MLVFKERGQEKAELPGEKEKLLGSLVGMFKLSNMTFGN